MVVNKGFSFSNMVGEYALDENEQQNNYVNEDCCIVERYPGKLKTLYSQNSFEEGSIAHEFASIDISDIKAILKFCSKYGLLYSSRIERNITNDYMFFHEHKSNFSQIIPTDKQDRLFLSTFKREVITMRRFLGIKSAIDSKNLVLIVDNLIKFLLTYTDRTHIPSDTETERFNYYFYLFIRHRYRYYSDLEEHRDYFNKFADFDIQAAIGDFLDVLEIYIHLDTDEERKSQFGTVLKLDDMFHCTWQAYHTILTKLKSITIIQSDTDGRNITFSPELSLELLSNAGITLENVSIAANACISDIMNSQTGYITPELRYEKGTLIADWHITTLLEAMYMELQVTFSPNTQIKKCANPTCNSFFNVPVENKRKIYCCERCALLMAKRKQRERDKSKKQN